MLFISRLNVLFSLTVILSLIQIAHLYLYQIIEHIPDAVVEDKGTAYLNCTMAIDPKLKDRAMWYEDQNMRQISRGENVNEPVRKGPNGVAKYAVRFIDGRGFYIPRRIFGTKEVYDVFIYQLIVRFAAIEDKSRYKCAIEIKGLPQPEWPVAYGLVIVQKEPQITPLAKPLIVDEGSPIVIPCQATGSPTPKVSWTKANGRPLPLDGNPQRVYNTTLVVPKASKWDRGIYRCHAQNNVGRAAEYDVMVEVNYKPQVRVARYKGAYAQAFLGQFNIMLECIINGYPDPDLYWYKGIYDPDLNDKILMDNEIYESEKMTSYGAAGMNITDVFFTMVIRNVKANDLGNYTCRAANKLGYDTAVVNLFPQSHCQGPTCFMMMQSQPGVASRSISPRSFLIFSLSALSLLLASRSSSSFATILAD